MLTDRFSNIHYLMRHGRTGKLKMHWFVMMLRALFDDKEFAEAAATAVRYSASDVSAGSGESLFLAQNALAFANTAASSEALALLDAQPEEVKLAFDTVRDAFLAQADKDHLHRLAPECRALVLRLLERLG